MAQVAREEARDAAARGGDPRADDDDGDGDERDVGLDALELIEALGRRHEESTAQVLAWSWKIFCARWGQLYAWSAKERERQEAREVERAFAKLHAGW